MMSSVHRPFKGKQSVSQHSWHLLPPDLVRLIATYALVEHTASSSCPIMWDPPELWLSKATFQMYRDSLVLSNLMAVTPAWSIALEAHSFWHHALATLDPMSVSNIVLGSLPARPVHLGGSVTWGGLRNLQVSPYRRWIRIAGSSCAVCRINNPQSPIGLMNADLDNKPASTIHLGDVPLCRHHHEAPITAYCTVCLTTNERWGIFENDDTEPWNPQTPLATCRNCRHEAIWSKVKDDWTARAALGIEDGLWTEDGVDWETLQAIEAFLDVGEGTVRDVITVGREKYWLRKNTRMTDLLNQAIAASRYAQAANDDPEEDEEYDYDDAELLGMTEESGGVRELAMGDWARTRIMDGLWLSPADAWYKYCVPGQSTTPHAVHPCPWTMDDVDPDSEHPTKAVISMSIPPTFSLCEQVLQAHVRQLRIILMPPLRNLVRKIVIESSADGVDPAARASKMDMEDVLTYLREEEGIWYNGVDWLERKTNEARRRRLEEERSDELSLKSSKSDGSHSGSTTSPVLSTSTLRTTPSPPPANEKIDSVSSVPHIPIPVSPVLKVPELLHNVPYVPVTSTGFPQYTMQAFTAVWRDVSAPIYHCRCCICERAMMKANMASGNTLSQTVPRQVQIVNKVRPPKSSPKTAADLLYPDECATYNNALGDDDDDNDDNEELSDGTDTYSDDWDEEVGEEADNVTQLQTIQQVGVNAPEDEITLEGSQEDDSDTLSSVDSGERLENDFEESEGRKSTPQVSKKLTLTPITSSRKRIALESPIRPSRTGADGVSLDYGVHDRYSITDRKHATPLKKARLSVESPRRTPKRSAIPSRLLVTPSKRRSPSLSPADAAVCAPQSPSSSAEVHDRKRSSQELEEDEDPSEFADVAHKRARVEEEINVPKPISPPISRDDTSQLLRPQEVVSR